MAIIKCGNGHFYDGDKFDQCPHCRQGKENDRDLDDIVTISKNIFGGGVRKQEVLYRPADDAEEKNVRIPVRKEDDDKTISIFAEASKEEWVCGWLVCVRGINKGTDYKIRHGFNKIGRSISMQICVVGDASISRENHCSIVYDNKSNQFFLIPGEGTITYLEGDLVTEPMVLKNRVKIEIGESLFQFIAFCGGEVQWEDE